MKINFNGGNGGFHFGNNPGGGGAGGFNGTDFRGEDYQPQTPRAKAARKRVAKPGRRVLINIVVTAVFAFIYFYVALPAINLQSGDFYTFVFLVCAVYCIMAVLTSGFQGEGVKGYVGFVKKQCKIPFWIIVALIVVAILGSLTSVVIFRAHSYQALLPIENGTFADDVDELSFDQIPVLDKDSAIRLGNRKLGELSDMVSQFEVDENYTQINYKNRPVRVTSLMYGDWIKWLVNRSKGIPAYLVIDMTTQNVEVVRLDTGIKYTTAEHFSRNLYRYIRFRYPTYMFETPSFEIDDSGNPYWICSRKIKTIGLFGGEDVGGAVLVNAETGECTYYDIKSVPEWVDHVYNADLIVRQYDYYGRYHNGFINSILGQKDVRVTTSGYNYIALNDDVFMYTGVTSVTSDESNIGFILSNQRTKETRYYSCAGAEEYSAMQSAEGIVQQMSYVSTFPILLNISGEPTYFMSLKDNAGLVKTYAMVNMKQYQIVATGTTLQTCETAYIQQLVQNKIISGDAGAAVTASGSASGKVAEIRSAVLDGNTYYFIRLENDAVFYAVSASSCREAVTLSVGDEIEITYTAADGKPSIIDAYSITIGGKTSVVEQTDNGSAGGTADNAGAAG
jgi:hypothetical protein